jgi:hypothetical protein
LFSFSIQHHQRVPYIAYGWCRGNNIFDIIPAWPAVRIELGANPSSVDINFISLEAAAVLSYTTLFFDNGMVTGPSMVDPVRHPYYFNHEPNPYAKQWFAFCEGDSEI